MSRIVRGSLGRLREEYAPYLRQAFEWQLLRPAEARSGGEAGPREASQPAFVRSGGRAATAKLIGCLPPGILARLARRLGVPVPAAGPPLSDVPLSMARDLVAEAGAGAAQGSSIPRLLDETLGRAFLGMHDVQRIADRAADARRVQRPACMRLGLVRVLAIGRGIHVTPAARPSQQLGPGVREARHRQHSPPLQRSAGPGGTLGVGGHRGSPICGKKGSEGHTLVEPDALLYMPSGACD